MNRRTCFGALIALWAVAGMAAAAPAANVWLSLDLQFNVPGDFNSGGTWKTVAKSEEFGIAGLALKLANATTFDAFLAPSEWQVQRQAIIGGARDIVIGDDLSPPIALGIGVVGSSFPSTYVDPPGLVPFGSYQDLGSFTGGVALATGTFAPGVVTNWFAGAEPSSAAANTFTVNSMAVAAVTFVTVRHVVPEPSTWPILSAGTAAIMAAWRRRTGA